MLSSFAVSLIRFVYASVTPLYCFRLAQTSKTTDNTPMFVSESILYLSFYRTNLCPIQDCEGI